MVQDVRNEMMMNPTKADSIYQSNYDLALDSNKIEVAQLLDLYHLDFKIRTGKLGQASSRYLAMLKKIDESGKCCNNVVIRNHISHYYNSSNLIDSALLFNHQAEEILKSQDKVNYFLMAEMLSRRALSFSRLNRVQESIDIRKQALKYYRGRGKYTISIQFHELAISYQRINEMDSFLLYREKFYNIMTQKYNLEFSDFHNQLYPQTLDGKLDFERTLKLLPKLRTQSKYFRPEFLYSKFAKYHFEEGNFKNSIAWIDSALHYVSAIESKYKFLNQKIDALKADDQYEAALAAIDTLNNLEATKNLIRSQQRVDSLQIAFDTKQKESELLQNEIDISKAKRQKNIWLILAALGGLIAIVFWQRAKRKELKNSQLKIEQQQVVALLEMKALRSQMNPHFLFNTLNSINWYIIKNKPIEASKYLTKFSKLVRHILENSKVDFISLKQELETLQLYVDLEKIRFEQEFDFEIQLDNRLDSSAISIPPLILQPFVENSIWHGLMSKKEKGKIIINIEKKEDVLYLTIGDNGIGRKASKALQNKSNPSKKSHGVQITIDRIKALNRTLISHPVTFTDSLEPETGTQVEIRIPFKAFLKTTSS